LLQERALPEFIDSLSHRWKLILWVAVLVAAGATWYVESLPAQYETKATVVFSPRAQVETASSDSVRLLLPKYVAYATAPATVDQLAPSLGQAPDVLERAVNATPVTDSGNLVIGVQMSDPDEAADAANAFARATVAFSETDRLITGEIVAPALAPESPSGPPRRLLEASALAAGLLVAVGLSFLVERGRPRLRTWRDMARATGHPVIGRVPTSRVLKSRPRDGFADPRVGAAFRTLRTSLEHEWRDRTVGVIAITSPTPGDGKTTVAALFAESLARLGSKVLLVDADLRRPGLTTKFRVDSPAGLGAVLEGRALVSEAVAAGWVDGLWVLPGSPNADAGDLIARRFEEVMHEARGSYDVVVVDTPPLIGTDDARTVASISDGVLLVIAARSTTDAVNEAVLALEGLRAPVLGVIGNHLHEGRSAYYS
jgi:polysaccharide biosynthesis transport protein